MVIDSIVTNETDPNAICADRYAALHARVQLGVREQVVDAADKLVLSVDRAGPTCRVDTDAAIGDLAYQWQMELPKSEADPMQIAKLWDLAIKIATTEKRRATALRDRAYLMWQVAERKRSPASWLEAADAFDAAAKANPSDPELSAGAIDSRTNARLVTRR